jgi:hypothetical protein
LRFAALDLRQSFDLTAASSSTDIVLEDRASPRFRKVGRMRRLYFCALVLGFVGFFGNRINARSSDAVVTTPPNFLGESHNAYIPRLLDTTSTDGPIRLVALPSSALDQFVPPAICEQSALLKIVTD